MRPEDSLFHSTVVMTLSKSMRYVTKTQVELVDVSWRERNKLIQPPIDTIKKKISSLDRLYSLLDLNLC